MPKPKCKCNKYANFGLPKDKKPRCCKNCKTDDMTNIISKNCICGKCRPSFGLPENRKAIIQTNINYMEKVIIHNLIHV